MIRVLTTTPRARARAHRPLRAQPSSSLLALTGLALVRPRRSKALATERDRPGDRPAGPPSRTPHLQRPQMGAKIIVLARLGAQGGTWAIDSSTIPDLGEEQNKGPSRTPAHHKSGLNAAQSLLQSRVRAQVGSRQHGCTMALLPLPSTHPGHGARGRRQAQWRKGTIERLRGPFVPRESHADHAMLRGLKRALGTETRDFSNV